MENGEPSRQSSPFSFLLSLFSKTSGHQSAALLLANDLHPLHHALTTASCPHEVDAAGEVGYVELGYPNAIIHIAAEHVVDLQVVGCGIAVSEEHALARWIRPQLEGHRHGGGAASGRCARK